MSSASGDWVRGAVWALVSAVAAGCVALLTGILVDEIRDNTRRLEGVRLEARDRMEAIERRIDLLDFYHRGVHGAPDWIILYDHPGRRAH